MRAGDEHLSGEVVDNIVIDKKFTKAGSVKQDKSAYSNICTSGTFDSYTLDSFSIPVYHFGMK